MEKMQEAPCQDSHILIEFPNGEVAIATRQQYNQSLQHPNPNYAFFKCFCCKKILEYQKGLKAAQCAFCGSYNRTPEGVQERPVYDSPPMQIYDCPYCKSQVQAPLLAIRMICGVCKQKFSITQTGMKPGRTGTSRFLFGH